jgi:hypothetical protein
MGAAMEDLTRTQPDVMRTQPLETVAVRPRARETRSFRLVRTIVFGVAIMVGIATVIVLATSDGGSVPNSSGLFSPSGHVPGERSTDPNVSISWTAVQGAAGYWWAMVEDPDHMPTPVIRPSGRDRRVFFRFTGRGYFALRTAFRDGDRLKWSDRLLYGPIVVRESASEGAAAQVSPGPDATDGAGDESGSSSGTGGRSASSGAGASGPRATPVDPRYAGEAGECPPGANPSQCGGAGQPGQPAQQPGSGGDSAGRPGNAPGQPGASGPDGAPGPD